MKLIPYMIFIFLWATFCYDPVARWIFYSRGWLNGYGIMDFAGGLVVHMSSGISGLVAALILGARAHFDPDVLHAGQTNLPFTILGTGLLWVGWMGFNGGSGLAADGTAALAIVNTNVAAAGSMVIWMVLDIAVAKLRHQQSFYVSIPGLCSATVVGLVVVTPAAGYVQPGYALLMGVVGGIVIYLFLSGKKRFFHIDDTLDVFSCHGIGGFVGTMLTGLFAQSSVNVKAVNGAFYGYPMQLCYQLLGAVVVTVYSAACTAAILLPMHFTIGIRIARVDQVRGLDNVAHGVMEFEAPVKIQPGAKISTIAKQRKESQGIATIQLDR